MCPSWLLAAPSPAERDREQSWAPRQRSERSGWMFIVHTGPRLQLLQMCWQRSVPSAPLSRGGRSPWPRVVPARHSL